MGDRPLLSQKKTNYLIGNNTALRAIIRSGELNAQYAQTPGMNRAEAISYAKVGAQFVAGCGTSQRQDWPAWSHEWNGDLRRPWTRT